MFKTVVNYAEVIMLGDYAIMSSHIEEIEVDGNKVLIHMSSGRKRIFDFANYEKAQEFSINLLKIMGFKNEQ